MSLQNPESAKLSAEMRPVLKWILNFVIVAGVILAVWPLGQTAFARYQQRALAREFAAQPKPASKPKKSEKTAKKVVAAAPKIEKWPLTKLSIPELDVDTYVVQGWDDASLRRGPGHFEKSALPGAGNCVIAAHRNVYGSYFANVDQLLPGANIVLSNRDGQWVYAVDSISITSASDFSMLQPPPGDQKPVLTLVTCTLPHTPNRVIVRAILK